MNDTTSNGGAVRVYHLPPTGLVTNSEFVDSKETLPRDTNGACPMPLPPCP